MAEGHLGRRRSSCGTWGEGHLKALNLTHGIPTYNTNLHHNGSCLCVHRPPQNVAILGARNIHIGGLGEDTKGHGSRLGAFCTGISESWVPEVWSTKTAHPLPTTDSLLAGKRYSLRKKREMSFKGQSPHLGRSQEEIWGKTNKQLSWHLGISMAGEQCATSQEVPMCPAVSTERKEGLRRPRMRKRKPRPGTLRSEAKAQPPVSKCGCRHMTQSQMESGIPVD
jgi:hypothetical protein